MKKVLIIGAGFAGLNLAKSLDKNLFDITIVDKNNYHLFQPLLYQVATAGLSPADIAVPVRSIFRSHPHIRVLLAEVVGVDKERKIVHTQEDKDLPYDILVFATGAKTHYFGHDAEWESLSTGLKSIEDALDIRQKILLSFEKAELCDNPVECEKLKTFVVIGGGPTGVELAGAIAELAFDVFPGDFSGQNTKTSTVYLIEAGPRVLPSFPAKLSRLAVKDLERMGVHVKLESSVKEITSHGVMLENKNKAELFIETKNIFWAAGVKASNVAQMLGLDASLIDRMGRVVVEKNLNIPGFDDIFVLGDAACFKDAKGNPLPGMAPAAIQEGQYLGKMLSLLANNSDLSLKELKAFEYFNKGQMATIGRKKAIVAMTERLCFGGLLAWFGWLLIHLLYLVGFKNRVTVLFQWIWSYLTYQRGARLITFDSKSRSKLKD